MLVTDFDFTLPEDLIALRPAVPRHSARQLIVRGDVITDNIVQNLADHLEAGDLIVFNDTKVIPSYLFATRGDMQTECNLHKRVSPIDWLAFIKKSKRLNVGDTLVFGEGKLTATITEKHDGGEVLLKFDVKAGMLETVLAEIGLMPLPPYIASKRDVDDKDKDDYQTMFAQREGAVAAPTASLHFTDELMATLEGKGVKSAKLTLHVGAGTFLPMKVDDTKDHVMHAEWGEVPEDVAALINQTHAAGRRVIAVGTTVLRLLESATDEGGQTRSFSGDTDIFITPGYKFRCVDLLMTNFHLPKSTLFMLVCAFAGMDNMKSAYSYAIENKYRFYSYGDSSLLWCKNRI
ncbi:MAG: tRNA preQ1(34) S-adenosylmethionine ribosyltransferase-isomerase QueA [Alphaproteobacteria bacterium RIFCSPHIGHO2_02_FULL_46_13]|nr:MAG: tRNA preQ1(34) S-adenosylmethionine ribosyltransferase-isomerase QueA [Alphaproteobacteria bacterium RIFCSPHIGHO2_02_FULL_46_13]